MKFKGSKISKKDDEAMLPKAFIQSEKDLNRVFNNMVRTFNTSKLQRLFLSHQIAHYMQIWKILLDFQTPLMMKTSCQQANIWITIFDINQDTLNNAITRDPISLPTFLHTKKNLYPLNNEVESTKLSTHYSYIYNTNQ